MSRSLVNNLKGVLLPATTPFLETGEIDSSALAANLAKWNRSGISGYVLLGSTGERVHLDEREYLSLIELARREVPRELAFIVGAGQQSTRGTINEIKKAAQAEADAVLVITPSFYRTAITQETLVSYYTAVADAAPAPVLLYSMPPLTGVKIEAETVARLSEHPNIIGVKDSSNDVAGFSKTVGLCRDEFAVMTGNGTVFLDALSAGATGAILAVGCVVPEMCVEIFRAFHASEEHASEEAKPPEIEQVRKGGLPPPAGERARTLQAKLTPLAAAVTTRFGIGGLKAALDLAGYNGGSVRAPLRAPDENARREIAALLEDTGIHLQ